MKRIRLAPGLASDLDTLVDTRLLIQANSGGGKSWCLRRLLEQSHGAVQHLVIDPEGEFASLREKFDYVLAARHGGDTAAEPRAARLLAERLLELRASAILDIYELKAHDRVRFVRFFLEALVDAPKKLWHPALVVVDEAHVYCPQQGEAESAAAVIDLATRGRKRGFCAALATQRLSKLHKDAAAELNNKLIGRTGLDVDVKRAADELGFGKDRWRELRELEAGEFFAFGPALSREVRRAKIGGILTTHPKAGARLAFTAPPPTRRIRALLPKLSDLPAESERKAKTEADLRAEIRGLRAQVTARTRSVPVPKRVEIPVIPVRLVARVEKAVLSHARLGLRLLDATEPVQSAIKDLQRTITAATKQPPAPPPAPPIPFRRPSAPIAARERSQRGDSGVRLRTGERRMLLVLGQFDHLGGVTRNQLALLSGYTRSGTFDTYVGNLRRLDLCSNHGGRLRITAGGHEELAGEELPPPSTTEDLVALFSGKLRTGERKMFQLLVQAYPEGLSRNELAERSGYTRSGTFDTYVGTLTRNLLAVRDAGLLTASETLFLGGHS